jgi:DNA-binding transcriptional MerR regulator
MASKISGVGVHTIRAWEKRYKALDPNRDASGHRTYTKLDIEKLMLLSELCLLGYTISKVANLSIVELKNLLKDLGKTEESMESQDFNLVKEKPSVDAAQSLPILIFALRNYKIDVISQELGKLKSLVSPRDFALEIIYPLGTELAELCRNGQYSSHQEQVVRSLFKFSLGYNLYRPSEKRERGHMNVLVGGIEGDLTDISLSCVGLLCNHYGFNYTYAGPGLSSEALSDEARFLEANLVIVGPTNILANFGASHFHSYIEKLMAKIPANTDVIIAGVSEFDLEKLGNKRLRVLKSVGAVDEFLSQKTN